MQDHPTYEEEIESHLGYRSGSGRKEPVPHRFLTLDDAFRAFAGHKYEVLTILALHGPLPVSEIAACLQLVVFAVSRDLALLQRFQLVEWMPLKNRHVFRLTEHVRAFKWNGKVQMNVQMPNGDWVLVHREEFSTQGRPIPAPCFFVDGGSRTTTVKTAQPIVQHDWAESTRPKDRHGRSEEPEPEPEPQAQPPVKAKRSRRS